MPSLEATEEETGKFSAMDGRDEDEKELDEVVIILSAISVFLTFLVIVMCIKLNCCRQTSTSWRSRDDRPDVITEVGQVHRRSHGARGEENIGFEMFEDYGRDHCEPRCDNEQFSSPTKTKGTMPSMALYSHIGQNLSVAEDVPAAHQSEAYIGCDPPPSRSVAADTASLNEINEEETDMPGPAALSQVQTDPEGFVPSLEEAEEEELMIDSQLQELMHPDMKESKLVKVHSKLLVFISRKIDDNGGQLVLDKMGISLFIPPCAIERGHPQIIFLALNWDLEDFPLMSNSQTIVSPVVHVGPHGLNLKRPATLSFRHCAFDPGHIKVYSSQTNLMERKAWRVSEATLQHGKDKTHTILDTECQVHISHFTLYTCIAEGDASKKWLQLVAFGGRMRVHRHYEIRVYLLNNTPCALQFAIENERKHGFKAIKCPQEFLFTGDGGDMCLQVEGVNEGWSANLMDLKDTVPYLSVWHGKCPFVSFIFKHEKEETKDISTTISSFQASNPEYKLKLKLVAKMSRRRRRRKTDKVEPLCSDQASDTSSQSENSLGSSQSSGVGPSPKRSNQFDPGDPEMRSFSDCSGTSSDTTSCSRSEVPCGIRRGILIPHKLRMALVHLLEPSDLFGNDWRMVASDLGMDTKIPMLKEKGNAFEEVLKIMEEQKKDLYWLADSLTKHKRLDAASIITSYLQTGEIHS